MTTGADPEPGKPDRITSLDFIRGVAVLGILLMNVVSMGLNTAPYFNLSAGGNVTALDWVVGGFGEIVADQKFMGIFSLLFGAGVVLFVDNAAAKGKRAVLLSLWRNALLFVIGCLHLMVWEGDVLLLYALCAPVVIFVRRLPPWLLVVAGVGMLACIPLTAVVMQTTVGPGGEELGGYWLAHLTTEDIKDGPGLFMLVDYFFRAIAMMLIGAAAYRTGVLSGERSVRWYKTTAAVGLFVGLTLAAVGLAWVVTEDFHPSVALIGSIPNTVGTLPCVLGYVALLTLWNQREETRLHRQIRAVGRMALSNYVMHTVIGLGLLRVAFEGPYPRTLLLALTVTIWFLQLYASEAWLKRFRFGPLEWVWRCATYRRWVAMR